MKPLNRRDTLKLIALTPVAGVALAGCATPDDEHTHEITDPAAPVQPTFRDGTVHEPPMFFTEHEYETLHRLVDFIIPADAVSGSATDAGVPAFIDFRMLDIDEPEAVQVQMRGGLAWLDAQCHKRFGGAFVDVEAAQCRELLDQIAFPDDVASGLEPGAAFFSLARDMTAIAFYTTPMGFDDLQYVGNTFVAEWNGVPSEVLDHVGISYDTWPQRLG